MNFGMRVGKHNVFRKREEAGDSVRVRKGREMRLEKQRWQVIKICITKRSADFIDNWEYLIKF